MNNEIRFKIKYRVPPHIIFTALTNADDISKYCQCPSKFDKSKGGAFNLYDGSIIGTVVDIDDNKLLVLNWKFSNWKKEAIVSIVFKERAGNESLLKITIKNCPNRDINDQTIDYDTVILGFKQQIFQKIATFLGYPINNDSDSDDD